MKIMKCIGKSDKGPDDRQKGIAIYKIEILNGLRVSRRGKPIGHDAIPDAI